MTFKRKALGALTRVELLEVGKALELDVTTNMRLDEMMDGVLPGRVRSRGVAHSAGLSARPDLGGGRRQRRNQVEGGSSAVSASW